MKLFLLKFCLTNDSIYSCPCARVLSSLVDPGGLVIECVKVTDATTFRTTLAEEIR